MTRTVPEELGPLSMIELFRLEAENQSAGLTAGLLELERGDPTPEILENLMRAAHSLKGAARMVSLEPAVLLAHAMEDCFVAAQQHKLALRQPEVDALLRALDLLGRLARGDAGGRSASAEISKALSGIAAMLPPGCQTFAAPHDAAPGTARAGAVPLPMDGMEAVNSLTIRKPESSERVLRLTAENLNRLLGLAGESLVESRWLRPYADSLQELGRKHTALRRKLEAIRQELSASDAGSVGERMNELYQQLIEAQHFLGERLQDLDLFDRRFTQLSQRLYLEALRTRMRPFSEGVRRFPRMVRDLSLSLEKQVRLEILGENTQVDRDILERIETPLAHLLRNAVDHGCESPAERLAAGKPAEASLRLEARHSAGVLLVTVSDDGRGVDLEVLRATIVRKGLAAESAAARFSESELLNFLFLPGLTLRETVTDISGRGVGLDVVQTMLKSVRGAVRLGNQPGRGLRVQLQLPLTLSVLRALLVEIAGEPYAIPLTQLVRAMTVPRDRLDRVAGRWCFYHGGQPVALLSAHQVLECGEAPAIGEEAAVVLIGDRSTRHGLVVDRFLGERELVVQPLDPRLGRVKDISAAALTEDGSPVLIMDVDEVADSIERLIAPSPDEPAQRAARAPARPRKRILTVDDSGTVRELQRKILGARGYLVEAAVDGVEGWQAVQASRYDLVITDIDMPKMDGLELVSMIKQDPALRAIPVLVLSYKEGDSDRLRGLDAGADLYLAKGAFDDASLLRAVAGLIGGPEA